MKMNKNTTHIIKVLARTSHDLDDVNDLQMRSLVKIQLERGNVLDVLETEWLGQIVPAEQLEGESK